MKCSNEYREKRSKDLPPGWKSNDSRCLKLGTEYSRMHEINYSVSENNSEENIKETFTNIVYSEGNTDIDPYNAIVDTGCPKTVCGKAFMDSFTASKGDDIFVKRKIENECFRFGNGEIYVSNESCEIEVEIGTMTTKICTSVIEADIPLLLGLDYLKSWGAVIDIENHRIFIKKVMNHSKLIENSQTIGSCQFREIKHFTNKHRNLC